MIKKILILLVTILMVSCNDSKDVGHEFTTFGGEIVNPKGKTIIIFKDDAVVDTLTLSEDNTFQYTFKNPKAGLYSFQHNEFQMFYLEPGDSLRLRVNTMDFDESLHYSGRGSKENNLLMELFLQNEKDIKTLGAFYMLEPTQFQEKLDSLNKRNKSKYDAFIAKHKPSEGFKSVAQSNCKYNHYIKKELYTSVLNKNEERVATAVFPKNFYEYRENIDFNNSSLRTYYPYYRFLNIYFDNITYPSYAKEGGQNNRSFKHVYKKVALIDSLVPNDSLKHKLIVRNVRRYLLSAKNVENERKMVAFFKKHVDNPKAQEEIDALAEATMKLTPGQTLPNILLLNTGNATEGLHAILKKDAVLYFWSLESVKHFKDIHSKAAELASKYPEYQFVGINTDTHFKKWLKAVKASGYNQANEYQFEDIETAEKKLLLNSHNKALIITKTGEILESNTNLFNPKIEQQLLGFLNQ
ncbi:hypothetical protein G5B37_04135 [Rasiella rasia]|uniref:Thioredoxin domain-containing protein n=1 Tax=Rasiella rasia TaxID=2744027 RepID=A0A6G6GJS6_9FLAO|nr:hypothetical protein [Rasiella rasia]QIE58777.1 hypothetical protein G5B37_04135 [Rasiella rasia]